MPGLTTRELSASYFLHGIRVIPPKTKLFHIHSLTQKHASLFIFIQRYTEDMSEPHKRQHALFTESNYGGNKSLWDDNNSEIN